MIARILACFAVLILGIGPASAQSSPAWSRPTAPFHIAGPIWYVGTEGLGVYAVVTREGTILVSGPLAESAGLVERNLATIGVRPHQIKWILNSHAHFDHAAAFAELRRWSGAELVASAGDAPALRRGRHEADNENGHTRFAPVPVDRIVRDGEQVRVGDVALTAVLTPGHTPGCTTWTTAIVDHGRRLNVVFPCSVTVAGNRLIGNRAYPGIVADYRRSFDRLATLPADIVLPMHPDLVDLLGRAKRRDAGATDAFVDRTVLPRLVTDARRDFASALAREPGR
ncbi:subclass B3 metallo-beta-lactamase [Sphingomonas sp. PAMC 26605]|uniref:subclass B3 metallo-beta-lactamase n=1 Tax=Sphingomonas sp. PAMC 26605 TaxID=1112214 RepID=UPI00026CA711|nr:subclass B3 metallo-beta-lactamase [Sphingomonas sp. PAMC 26605]